MLKPFATKLDEQVLAKLDELSEKTQIPKSRLCKQAIELLIAHYGRRDENLEFAERMRNQESLMALQGSRS